jgi:hypothetical protein
VRYSVAKWVNKCNDVSGQHIEQLL